MSVVILKNLNECKNCFRKTKSFNTELYIKKVIYNGPATIVFWSDGSKTTSQCDKRDHYDKEKGLSIAINKKFLKGDYIQYLLEKYCKDKEDKTISKEVNNETNKEETEKESENDVNKKMD